MSLHHWPGRMVFRLLIAVCFTSLSIHAQKPLVRIGVVLDGPSSFSDSAFTIFEREISIILSDDYEVRFPSEKRLTGDWSEERVEEMVVRQLSDNEVDILLTLGFLSSQYVCLQKDLPKPVFAPYIAQATVQGIPNVIRRLTPPPPERPIEYFVSGVKNLTYLEFGGSLKQDISAFYEVVPFSRLAILIMQGWADAIPDMDRIKKEILGQIEADRLDIIPIGPSADSILASIPADLDAVYLTPAPRIDRIQREELAEGLIRKGLPSYSSWGRSDVEIGFLCGLRLEEQTLQRARRTAMMIQEVLEGTDAGELPVNFELEERLTINMATARSINVSPRYTTLIKAELLNEEPVQAARSVSLSSVVREASITNLDLAAADRSVAAGEDQVRERRSPLLPQVDLAGDITFRDGETAETVPQLFGKREYRGGISFRQQIYSDDDWTTFKIEKSLLDRRMSERAELRLDVILDAAASYLRILRSKSLERIQKDNLRLTREHLDLAQARVEIGVAGREELFRWQDQIATNQRSVVEFGALRAQSELALNRVLNRPLDEQFLTSEATLNDPELVASFEALTPYVESPGAFQLFNDFMVREAFEASPELKQLEASIRAKEQERDAANRSFFLPRFFVQGGYFFFDRVPAVELDPSFPKLNQTWEISINANLPLFQGAGRFARVSRTKNEIQELIFRQQATQQRVEQRIRSILERANASFIGIDLARDSAEAAQKNLELVKDSYAQGVVGILALLDAQNRALAANQAAANAVYTYLIDLMSVQRAVGRFDYYRSPQERQEYLSRLSRFYQEKGFRLRNP